MTRKLISLAFVLLLGLTACGQPESNTPAAPVNKGTEPVNNINAQVSTDTPVPPLPTDTQAPPAGTGLTAETLRNAVYTVTDMLGNVQSYQLVNGTYTKGSPGDTDFAYIAIGDQMAFGDLNGDGVDDAAVILQQNYGGTGTWVSVAAVLDQGGMPVHVSSALIDDRAIVSKVEISQAEIQVDATVHFVNDAMCCPSLVAPRSYRLVNNQLVMMNLSTRLEGGAERIITIQSPQDAAEVSNPVVVSGAVTISPFESTLNYKIYTGDGQLVNEGPLMVDAPDMGAPGTFELTFNLAMAGVTGLIRVEFWDLSPADGSPMAMAAVYLTLK
jgi:hypothetical protein